MNRRILSAALALVASAVSLILTASRTKEDIIELERKRTEKKHKVFRVKK